MKKTVFFSVILLLVSCALFAPSTSNITNGLSEYEVSLEKIDPHVFDERKYSIGDMVVDTRISGYVEKRSILNCEIGMSNDYSVTLDEEVFSIVRICEMSSDDISLRLNAPAKQVGDLGDNFYLIILENGAMEQAHFSILICEENLFLYVGGDYSERGIFTMKDKDE